MYETDRTDIVGPQMMIAYSFLEVYGRSRVCYSVSGLVNKLNLSSLVRSFPLSNKENMLLLRSKLTMSHKQHSSGIYCVK